MDVCVQRGRPSPSVRAERRLGGLVDHHRVGLQQRQADGFRIVDRQRHRAGPGSTSKVLTKVRTAFLPGAGVLTQGAPSPSRLSTSTTWVLR